MTPIAHRGGKGLAAETVQSKTEIDSPDNCCGHKLRPDDREVGAAIKHILGE